MTGDTINDRMDAVERLTKLFRVERMVYLGVTCGSVIILLVSAGIVVAQGKTTAAELTGLFGPAGLITYSSGRLLQMWTQALRLLGSESIGGS